MAAAVEAFLAFACFGLLVVVVYGPWQTFCVDWLRQELFEARAALFDLASDGRIAFDSQQYKDLRSGLETLIRFAHHISWPKYLLLSATRPAPVNPKRSSLIATLESIEDEELKQLIKKHIYRAAVAVAVMVVLRAPLLWVPCLVVLIASYVSRSIREVTKSRSTEMFDRIQKDAEFDEEEGFIGQTTRAARAGGRS